MEIVSESLYGVVTDDPEDPRFIQRPGYRP